MVLFFFKIFFFLDIIFFSFFVFICGVLSTLLVCVSLIGSKTTHTAEKLSPYECGFEPFSDTRGRFNVYFAIIGVLFLLLDIELVFLFPWLLVSKQLGFFGFWSLYSFLLFLTCGFIYEWKLGVFVCLR